MTKAKWEAFSEEEIRNLFKQSESYREVSLKMGYSPNGGSATQTMKNLIKKFSIDISHFTHNGNSKNTGRFKTPIEDYLDNKQPITSHKLRLRLLQEEYFEHKCQSCGLSEWLGNPIPLELHHRDGNKLNNNLDNLKMVCPNCHTLTDTYKSKNVKKNLQE
ncbi:MAG: hypothetical protein RBT35_08990 [Bacteroidales bacterium]|jgi:predicted HNH restriction endonuclease|nr:hypothetical protein [Bacteroidales bacterium]